VKEIELEFFDEYMKLCDLQTKNEKHQGRGFLPEDSIRDQVFLLIARIKEAGLKEEETSGSYFRNWFFKCHGKIKGLENIPDAIQYRTFSICVYSDGFMELRWG
jgi:hypothetical protein